MPVPSYSWPLMSDPFTLWDRIRLSAFLLNPRNRWTQGEQVKAFEQEMAAYVGCRHAVFVSSGSTANTLLAMYLKDRSRSHRRTTVVFPSTTWTTSVAPFVREGFAPRFLDISFDDLAIDMDRLETYLLEHHEEVAAVFVTGLLGMCPNISYLQSLQSHYPDVRFWMDNCENHLSRYDGCNVSSFMTSTTSTYWGHMCTSGEGGFVFTNSSDERDYCLMARNHGMTRSVEHPAMYRNTEVDARFDFNLLGSNFRNTDIAARIGRLDMARIGWYAERRQDLYDLFIDCLGQHGRIFEFIPKRGCSNVMFAIPIIPQPTPEQSDEERSAFKAAVEGYCVDEGIETRPIISGNLLAQRCYRQYGNRADYPTSEYIHRFGQYCGLFPSLQEDKVRALAGFINELP